MKLDTYRCSAPRRVGEGFRIGVVRYPPRGIHKEDYARLDYFDLWFPLLAPTTTLIRDYKEKGFGEKTLKWFTRAYQKELSQGSEKRQTVKLLNVMAKKTPISIGCYCEDEAYCHRTILARLVENA